MINRHGILIYGGLDKPMGLGIDGRTLFGDYYYTEALIKMIDRNEAF